MCLSTVDKEPKCKSGKGYKLLYEVASHLRTGYICGRMQSIQLGVPVRDTGKGIIKSGLGTLYPKGFHIFMSKAGLRRFQRDFGWHGSEVAVAAVDYKDVVATGIQTAFCENPGSSVVVAKEFTATKIIQHGGRLR